MKANIELLDYIREKALDDRTQEIISRFVEIASSFGKKSNLGLRLAAIFDLLISCQYYNKIANRGWTYCGKGSPMMFYPYTNVCPRCLGKKEFVFAKANKPESGQIGQFTTEILCEMLVSLFRLNGRCVNVYKASEPIDVIFHEPLTGMMIISEVKAAPLLTIPISVACEQITEEVEGNLQTSAHCSLDNPFIHKSILSFYFPKTKKHKNAVFALDINWNESSPIFEAALRLSLKSSEFLTYYFSFWEEAYRAYENKERENQVFWITNGCGLPSPRPDNWPQRRTGGYESVSDAKSSVGMDRTDDIKKGIYQVLKLGAEFKPTYDGIKTALISNVHAVRHSDEYLKCIKDIIWTIDETRAICNWLDLPKNTPLYNLFDGVIAFTKSDIRDSEIKDLFNWAL